MLLTRLHQGFNPISLFAGPVKGVWYDQSDSSTGYQNSNQTTPHTASGQPTGWRTDKSGKTAAVIQATAGSRPTYTISGAISSDLFDGLDDAYATNVFSTGTLAASMDLFVAVKRNTTQTMLGIYNTAGSGTQYVGICSAAGGSNCSAGVGATQAYNVNGTDIGNNRTEAQLNAAFPTGTWGVLQVTGLDLSAWTTVSVGFYSSAYCLDGEVGGIIVCQAQTEDTRMRVRKWLGAKVGLSIS